jgi:anaerobic magnesium-protoporphyrin IX monomethyl ester cyclase
MRIVLIYAEMNPWPIPNLGILSVAGVLESNGHQVEIFDCSREFYNGRDPHKELDSFVQKNEDVDLYGIGFNTRQALDAFRIAKIIRCHRKEVKIVLGGPHPTAMPKETLSECPEGDFAVLREGEYTMLEIANGLSPKDIRGIWYREEDGSYATTGDRPLIENLDELPLTPWHLIDMEFYVSPKHYDDLYSPGWRYGTIYTSRGCFGKCNFCFSHGMLGTIGRVHSMERIVEEATILVEHYNVQLINIYDDTLFVTEEHGRQVAQAFIDSGLNKRVKWNCQTLAAQVTPELLDLLYEAGCFQVAIGFESVSPETLKTMRKPASYKRHIQTLEYFRNTGMRCLGYFMSGYFGERADQIIANQEFQKYANLDVASWTHYIPFPGTKDFEMLRENDQLGDFDWPTYNMTQNPVTIKKRNYSDTPDEEYIYLYQNHIEEYQFSRRYLNSLQRRVLRFSIDTGINFPAFEYQPPTLDWLPINSIECLIESVTAICNDDCATAHLRLMDIDGNSLPKDQRRIWLEGLIFIHLIRVEDVKAGNYLDALSELIEDAKIVGLKARANCSMGNYLNASRIIEKALMDDKPVSYDGRKILLYLGMLQGREDLIQLATSNIDLAETERTALARWQVLAETPYHIGLEKIFERYAIECPEVIDDTSTIFDTAVAPHRYRYLAHYLRLSEKLREKRYNNIVLVGFNRWSRHIARTVLDSCDFDFVGIIDDPVAKAQKLYDGYPLLTLEQAKLLSSDVAIVVAGDVSMPADLSFLGSGQKSRYIFHLFQDKKMETALPPSMNRDYFGSPANRIKNA